MGIAPFLRRFPVPSQYPFPHRGPVFVIADDRFEVAYYARAYCKYKRVRELGIQDWSDAPEQEIDHDHFLMVIACIERGKMVRDGMV